MKTLGKIIMIVSIIALLISITMLIIEWKKDSDLWHSVKGTVLKYIE